MILKPTWNPGWYPSTERGSYQSPRYPGGGQFRTGVAGPAMDHDPGLARDDGPSAEPYSQ
jgi:hypothetical protein